MDRHTLRLQLVNCAQKAVFKWGCYSVSVENICKEAGVQKGTFYGFFRSKNQILLEALEAIWNETQERIIEPLFSRNDDLEQRIARMFLAMHSWQTELRREVGFTPGCPFCAAGIERTQSNNPLRESVDRILHQYLICLENAFTLARLDSSMAFDEARAAKSVFSFLTGATTLARMTDNPEVIKQSTPSIKSLIASTANNSKSLTSPARIFQPPILVKKR